MTSICDKFSGGGGDVAPSPRSPASSEDRKKTQRTASVPIENCLIRGVQSGSLCTSCVQEGGFKGAEIGPKQRRINNRLLSYRPMPTWQQLSLLYRTRQILAILSPEIVPESPPQSPCSTVTLDCALGFAYSFPQRRHTSRARTSTPDATILLRTASAIRSAPGVSL